MREMGARTSNSPVGALGPDGAPTRPVHDVAVANRLLRALPPDELGRMLPDLVHTRLESGHVLSEPNEIAGRVYFPAGCVVSVVNEMGPSEAAEVGTIGLEGMAGLAAFLDADSIPSRVLVQVPGEALSLDARRLREHAEALPGLHRLLHRYAQAFLIQVGQTASCNRLHEIDRRCARWLLMTHDRVGRDTFMLTHEFLSFMLGVRRAGVTVAAGMLQRAGLIRYTRGRVSIVDRAGLEGAACDCYGIVRDQFDRLLGTPA